MVLTGKHTHDAAPRLGWDTHATKAEAREDGGTAGHEGGGDEAWGRLRASLGALRDPDLPTSVTHLPDFCQTLQVTVVMVNTHRASPVCQVLA